MWKYSRQCKTMPSRPLEFIPMFKPATWMKFSYGKISSPPTEISVGKTETSGTEPAHPLIWTHRKFCKGFRGKRKTRKPGQLGQPGSYEEVLNMFLEGGNVTVLVPRGRAHQKCRAPLGTKGLIKCSYKAYPVGMKFHIFEGLVRLIRLSQRVSEYFLCSKGSYIPYPAPNMQEWNVSSTKKHSSLQKGGSVAGREIVVKEVLVLALFCCFPHLR